jgi:hypothetical protein
MKRKKRKWCISLQITSLLKRRIMMSLSSKKILRRLHMPFNQKISL